MLTRRALTTLCLMGLMLWLPEAAWVGVHLLAHHHHPGHEGEADSCVALGAVLTHGHAHHEGQPDHDHDVVKAPQSAPRFLPDSSPASLALGANVLEAGSAAAPWWVSLAPRPRTGPPLLALLCTLRN